MDRRTFAAALMLAPAAGVPTTVAAASINDQLPELVADWFRHKAVTDEAYRLLNVEYSETGDVSWETDREHDRLLDILTDKGRVICATPATTREGLYAQLRFFLAEFGDDLRNAYGAGYEKMAPTFHTGLENVAKIQAGNV